MILSKENLNRVYKKVVVNKSETAANRVMRTIYAGWKGSTELWEECKADFPKHERESQRLEARSSSAGLEPASRATRFTGGGDYVRTVYIQTL